MNGTNAIDDSWRLEPAPPSLRGELGRAAKAFGTAALGGFLSFAALGMLVAPATVRTCGATRGLRVQRERQDLCLRLGLTPQELAELEAEVPLASLRAREDFERLLETGRLQALCQERRYERLRTLARGEGVVPSGEDRP